VARPQLSPAMRVFVAVDVVLVLALVAVFLLTRPGGDEDAGRPVASTAAPASSSASGEGGEPEEPEQSTSGEEGEPVLFASPSGNITCTITPEEASCAIATVAEGALVEDESCGGTVGHLVRVTAEGAERPCVPGDPPGTAPEGTPVLEYDETTSAFGFTCTSSRSGVICRHDGTGHGFSVARAGSSLF
jgi:hypothetical protein